MTRRSTRLRAEPQDADADARRCDSPGCEAAGVYRAPRDRSLSAWYWFCLEHVRAYNAAWDYYKGMGPTEIEAHLRQDASWQRPTWPLGRLGSYGHIDPAVLADPLGLLDRAATRRRPPPEPTEAPPELRAALDLLGLPWPVEQKDLRARYKELAKRYHPDATGGDRSSEERLKDINRAYSLLRQRVPPRRAAPQGAPAAAG